MRPNSALQYLAVQNCPCGVFEVELLAGVVGTATVQDMLYCPWPKVFCVWQCGAEGLTDALPIGRVDSISAKE